MKTYTTTKKIVTFRFMLQIRKLSSIPYVETKEKVRK